MKQSEQLLQWAIEAEEQAKHETALHLKARCNADRRYYLNKAAELEKIGQ
jgi:hypothetical protein